MHIDLYMQIYVFYMNYMSMGIGRHYIIRRDITTKLYIMRYGYVIEVIVEYCDTTCTSNTELDTAGQKCVKQRCTYMYIYVYRYMHCFFYELHAYGYRSALHN